LIDPGRASPWPAGPTLSRIGFFISIKTVEAHRANIMEKLSANTVADLLKIALGQNAPKA
jgi:hypothetical protein